MLNQFSRTELLLGKEAMERLSRARVAVFGIGGVGGYTVEALVRSGVGAIDLIDDDKVCLTNLNRQIIATRSTVGKYKAEVMRDRILDINPDCKVVLLSAGDEIRVRFFELFVWRGRSLYCYVKDFAGHAGAGDRNADHQQHGRRQQAESCNV